ncbi:hypothetical protein AWB75_00017 [Caballeronia catudaia]|uniref:Uncharacterized protein n=1 Tax=Caballeronia catudaia TaxID=1777136 RepID=A0A157Z2H6_9BURK|nr:hypothetical protein [Caballeronia catudaia]SAK39197.1 hypothetical protein AWB75_00017 [Caballeronia catudaia]
MKPDQLRSHKQALKTLTASPKFRQMNKSKWPKPFNRMARPRVQATDLIPVSDAHRVLFMWRDGDEITDRSFYGHLIFTSPKGDLYPLFEFHYHPSHKGVHCKLPCETTIDYRNRLLPGAPELNLESSRVFDPGVSDDRSALIVLFCRATGITISNEQNGQGDLLCKLNS